VRDLYATLSAPPADPGRDRPRAVPGRDHDRLRRFAVLLPKSVAARSRSPPSPSTRASAGCSERASFPRGSTAATDTGRQSGWNRHLRCLAAAGQRLNAVACGGLVRQCHHAPKIRGEHAPVGRRPQPVQRAASRTPLPRHRAPHMQDATPPPVAVNPRSAMLELAVVLVLVLLNASSRYRSSRSSPPAEPPAGHGRRGPRRRAPPSRLPRIRGASSPRSRSDHAGRHPRRCLLRRGPRRPPRRWLAGSACPRRRRSHSASASSSRS